MRSERQGMGYPLHYVCCWVQDYSPETDKRLRSHLRPTNDSWQVDETYILVKGKHKYLYRIVDSQRMFEKSKAVKNHASRLTMSRIIAR